jgi:hypothetical protein
MLTLHMPMPLLITVIAALAVALLCFTLMVRWFISAMGIVRAERLERRINSLLTAAGNDFAELVRAEGKRLGEVRELVRTYAAQIESVADRIHQMTPADIRQALAAKAKFLADEQSRAARAAQAKAEAEAKRTRAWLSAVSGASPAEMAEVGRLGYGDDFEDDLKGRLDVWAARNRVTVAGRDPAATARALRLQAQATGSGRAPNPPRAGPSANGLSR